MFCGIGKTSCTKCIVYVFNRQFHMSSSLSARKNLIPKVHSDPGLRNLGKAHQDDADALNSLEDQYDETSEEINFMDLDNAYEDHFREKKWNKIKLERIITSKQFFKPRKNPLMLTFSEKEHMKFLHKSDPIQWDAKTLSENFPATVDIVKKILKAKWKVTPEKQKKIDKVVERNWQLLAEGKLDADSEVIEHCKKFVNNRQIILDRLKTDEFYLPEIKPEKMYNNNEMSAIICHYEKCIKNLEKDFECKQISDEKLPPNKKSSVEVIYEKIKEKHSIDLENKESFLLGKMVKSYQKNITLEELEKNILTKASRKKPLNLHEKAILETKLNDMSKNNNKNDLLECNEDVENIKIQSEGISLCHQSQMPVLVEKGENENYDNFLSNKKKDNIFHKQSSFSIDQKQAEINKISFLHTVSGNELINEKLQNLTKKSESSLMNKVKITKEPIKEEEYNLENVIPEKDTFGVTSCIKENTYVETDFRTSNNDLKDNLTDNQYPNKMETYVSKDSSELSSENKLKNLQSTSENSLENISNEIQDDDIETTGFWNSNNDKAVAEAQKASLGPKKIFKSLRTAKDEPYPLKIIIPKEKRCSGLTYKLKDCYYDDDGTFLYRVPGMTK